MRRKCFRPYRFYAQKVLPAVFDDSLSYYEVISRLAHIVNMLIDAVNDNADAITELQEKLDAYIEQTDDRLDILEREYGELRTLMEEIVAHGVAYDVTKGLFTSSMTANRRMWQAQMFDGYLVEDVADMTVKELSHMNVRHVAVDGRTYYEDMGKAQPDMPWQYGYQTDDFNVDEFIKKSDLTLIDVDNLHEHEIMGVLLKDSATDFPYTFDYMRRGTAKDLADLYIRWDDVMITTNQEVYD